MPPVTTRATPRRKPAAPRHPTVIDEDGRTVDEDLPEPVEFTVEFERDGEPEPHTFLARPRLTYKRMTDAARGQKTQGVGAVLLFEKLIRPALLDTDGVPAKWTAELEDGQFVDPDGETRDLSDLPGLLEFKAGSSKRRWLHLMDDDDDVEVELDAIADAYELLVGKAGSRPTRKSSR